MCVCVSGVTSELRKITSEVSSRVQDLLLEQVDLVHEQDLATNNTECEQQTGLIRIPD